MMNLTGKTTLIAQFGYPAAAFKAPMIYNPWFARQGIDAAVVPMGTSVVTTAISASRSIWCASSTATMGSSGPIIPSEPPW